MEITDELIDKLALLSRLKFDSVEKASIREDLSRMIAFVSKLNELDTTNVKPCLHISQNLDVLREDVTTDMLTLQQAMQNAPDPTASYFKVPKVISK